MFHLLKSWFDYIFAKKKVSRKNDIVQILPLILNYLASPSQLICTNKLISQKSKKYGLTLVLNQNDYLKKIHNAKLKKLVLVPHAYYRTIVPEVDFEYISLVLQESKPKVDLIITLDAYTKILYNGIKYLSGIHTLIFQYSDYYDCDWRFDGSNKLYQQTITDIDLKYLSGIHTLKLPHNMIITDNGLKHLSGIHTLELDWNQLITDEGLKHLSGIHNLNLYSNNNITDKGISYLTGIRFLNIRSSTKITNIGIGYLSGIHRLVLFKNEQVTDKGIKKLVGIKNLWINYNKGITDDGIGYLVNNVCVAPDIYITQDSHDTYWPINVNYKYKNWSAKQDKWCKDEEIK